MTIAMELINFLLHWMTIAVKWINFLALLEWHIAMLVNPQFSSHAPDMTIAMNSELILSTLR